MAKRHRVGQSARSCVSRIEELVLASSGADAFDLVLALAATRLHARGSPLTKPSHVRAAALRARRAWRWLELSSTLDVPDDVLVSVWELLGEAMSRGHGGGHGDALDAVFEELVTRVGKGQKGQFFTPRHVVAAMASAMSLSAGERVVDPACGSGAFLTHARASARVKTFGCDVDPRAIRVAKLLALASGEQPDARVRADALAMPDGKGAWPRRVDVVLTNPPFAGDVKDDRFEMSKLARRAERDAFFLEQAVKMLRPGGRLGIVLPHGKVGAPAWARLRQWLVSHVRVFAVVSLPKETFLPHTSQRTALVFARKRARGEVADLSERIFFAASTRPGKDASGEPIYRKGGAAVAIDHDLDDIGAALTAFLREEGFAG